MSRLVVSRVNFSFGQKNGFLSVLPNNSSNRRVHSISDCQQVRRKLAKFGNNIRWASTDKIVKSPFGDVTVPNVSLPQFVWQDVEKNADKPATTCATTGRSYNYGMMKMMISRCAKALLGHCGMKPGEVVGIMCPNIPEYIVTIHGAMEAGLIVTFVNPLYTPDEIKRQFENAGAKMIITIPQLLEVALIVAPQLFEYRTTICIGGEDDPSKNVHGLQSLLMADYKSELPGTNPREVCILPYSSGTTGLPKGVQLTHHNLVSNLVQSNHKAINDLIGMR